jgi:hypothetical protein
MGTFLSFNNIYKGFTNIEKSIGQFQGRPVNYKQKLYSLIMNLI